MEVDRYQILKLPRREQRYIVYELIKGLPDCLSKNLREEKANIESIAKELTERNTRKIYLTGCGNSYYTSIAAKFIMEKLTGIPSYADDAFELANYVFPSLNSLEDCAVIGISLSGRTKAFVDALKKASERGAYVVSVVGKEETPVKGFSKQIVVREGIREEIPVRERTFSATTYTLAILAWSIRSFLRGSDAYGSAIGVQLASIPALARRVIEEVEPRVSEIAGRYVLDEDFYFIGGGPNYATALDGALMLTEMSGARSYAWELEEACHGPFTALRRKDVLVFIMPPGNSTQRGTMVVRAVKRHIGCTIISVVRKGEEAEFIKWSDEVIEIPENVDEILAPILYAPSLHLFAFYKAVYANRNPDTHLIDVKGFDLLEKELHPPGWH